MKRASALRTCAIVGTIFSVLACSSSNPTLPPGVIPVDGGSNERGVAQSPDTRLVIDAAVVVDAGSPIDHQEAPSSIDVGIDVGSDVGSAIDGAIDGGVGAIDGATDAVLASKVAVTIVSPSAVLAVDGGSGVDGGDTVTPVIAKTDRLAPTVRVEVQSQGGDPTLDVVTSIKAMLVSETTKTTSLTISLNQIQYEVIPESDSKVYIYADTPFDLSGLAGDFYTLQVTAITAGGVSASASVRIYVDGGPIITFLQPAAAAHVKGSIVVTTMVVDNRSGITGVAFSIGQYEIAPGAIATNGAQYSTTIDFGSYNPPLDGSQLVTVSATNGNGNTSLASRSFTIDNVGPTITNTSPAKGDLIGKLLTINATVTDSAGVMDSSVIAVVANGDIHFDVNLTKVSEGVYQQLFDTTKLPSYTIFPSISFRAQDILGNESSMGYLVSLDNTPPIMDLDPPAHFQLIKKDGTCSWPFDPVGPDAIDDGSVVTQLFDIRARVEDMGNTPRTGTADFIPIAAVDPDTVKVLILDDTSLPLVVDTSDPPDGICDDINPDLMPSVAPQSSKEAQLIDMASMPANSGNGDFTYQPGSFCSGSAASSPDPLCITTYSKLKQQYMTYSLGYYAGLPSIWAIQPLVGDALQCGGRQFDASNNLHDGWACVAVEASDKLGNKQVSRPIRVCVVGTPGSTACDATASGGADIASVTFPSTLSGNVLVTTKAPVLGKNGAAVAKGDTLIFSKASPAAVASLNGAHAVNPQGSTGTQFLLTDLTTSPLYLWTPAPDPSATGVITVGGIGYVFVGTVGLVYQDGVATQVAGSGLDAVTSPVFLLASNANPTDADRLWSIENVQSTGFSLAGAKVTLSGFATASSVLPNCTGTVVKKASGSTVDATTPCKPWASFPERETMTIN